MDKAEAVFLAAVFFGCPTSPPCIKLSVPNGC
jgi:hypothetical protein